MEENLRQRAKSQLIRVTMPNGEVICYNRSLETYLEVLRKIGSENFPKINLTAAGKSFFSKEIYPEFKNTMKEVCDEWYVIITGGTPGMYMQLRSIAQQLGLNMEVEIGDNFITQKANVSRTRKSDDKLMVKLPDGNYIAGENPIDTLLETIYYIGPEVIMRKGLEYKSKPIVTRKKQFNGQVQVGSDMWLNVPGTTKEKYKMLVIINIMMKLGLEITLL
jgi:hypothetical protein